jgi:hypothetical protein
MNKHWLMLGLLSTVGYANTISTPGKAIIVGNSNNALAKRVCYYQDKAYSLGAILQVGENDMICSEENAHESNGPLRWFPLGQERSEISNKPSYKVD